MKSIAKIIIIVAIFVFGVYIGQNYSILPESKISPEITAPLPNTEEPQIVSANLMLDFGDGTINSYTGIELAQGATVFDLLKKAADDNDIELNYQDYGGEMGVFVESIGEAKSDFAANRYWQYWVNDEYAKAGASLQPARRW